MKLTVLGCNGPYPAPGGACSGYFLQEGDTGVLLDCGAGVLAQLEKHMPPQNLTAIVLSHLHYDHMSDMLPLIYRCPGLPVYLPGAPAAVRTLLENAFELHDIAQGGQIGCLRMTACPGRHPVPAYAARFENCEGLRSAAGRWLLCPRAVERRKAPSERFSGCRDGGAGGREGAAADALYAGI